MQPWTSLRKCDDIINCNNRLQDNSGKHPYTKSND